MVDLVVIGERNDGAADAEDHGGMDLAVGVFDLWIVFNVGDSHGDHRCFFFLHIDEFDEALVQQISPA